MLRSLLAITASSLVLFAASSASAQSLGDKGELIISADRLVPLFAYNVNKFEEDAGGGLTRTNTSSQPSFSILPNVNSSVLGAGNFYNIPRVSLDYAVIQNLTIGGSVILAFTVGGSNETKAGTTSVSVDAPSQTLFGIAPRIGYTVHLTDLFTFWPRGGFGFYTYSSKSTNNDRGQSFTSTTSQNQFAINLEPVFAITPIPHVFFILGPVIDIPITGTRKTEQQQGGTTVTTSNSASQFHFGITAGLGGYFNL